MDPLRLSVSAERPRFPLLGVGETLEWSADKNLVPLQRQAGPYELEISRRDEDEFAAPVLKLTAGGQSVTLEGEMASTGFTNRISLISNRSGAVPVVMLQSYSGGAHCCNHVQLAGYSSGKLKVVDLGSWDGDELGIPRDVNQDGLVDFVMRDNRFLYAFSSYAESYAPPQILNVLGGKVVDVSRHPAFATLYGKEMKEAGEVCQSGNGSGANGACPAFVAAAARLGKLDQAWRQMIAAYDASVDWTLPTGCWVSDEQGCPPGQEITYKSYPEALHAFLVRTGYVAKSWVPPEQRRTTAPVSEPAFPDDRTA